MEFFENINCFKSGVSNANRDLNCGYYWSESLCQYSLVLKYPLLDMKSESTNLILQIRLAPSNDQF